MVLKISASEHYCSNLLIIYKERTSTSSSALSSDYKFRYNKVWLFATLILKYSVNDRLRAINILKFTDIKHNLHCTSLSIVKQLALWQDKICDSSVKSRKF